MQDPESKTGRGGGVARRLLVGLIALFLASILTLTAFFAYRTRRPTPGSSAEWHEARETVQKLASATRRLKQTIGFEQDGIPLAFSSTCRLDTSGRSVSLDGAHLPREEILPNDRLLVLTAGRIHEGEVRAVSSTEVLELSAPLRLSSRSAIRFCVLRDGVLIRGSVNLAQELDGSITAMGVAGRPVFNTCRQTFFRCPAARLDGGRLVDPWGRPYEYRIRNRNGLWLEYILSHGPNGHYTERDNLVAVVDPTPTPHAGTVDRLLQDLATGSLPVRRNAATTLAQTRAYEAGEGLLAATQDRRESLRCQAEMALAKMSERAMKDTSSMSAARRAKAVRFVGQASRGATFDSVAWLAELAEGDSSPLVRQAAREALDKIKKAQQEKQAKDKQPVETPAKPE